MYAFVRRLSTLFLLLSVLGLTSDVYAQTSNESGFSISASELIDLMPNSDVVVLHVARDSSDYRTGHIEGARFLSLNHIAVTRDAQQRMLPDWKALQDIFESVGISNDTYVVLYGEMNGLAATRAFLALDYMGHGKMSVLDGGFAAWQAEDGAISTEATSPIMPGKYRVKVHPQRIVTANQLESSIGEVAIIDARSIGEYSGGKPGNGITRPGHIPGAISMDWQMNLTDDGLMRPVSDLSKDYPVIGERVIVYCRTGMKASYAYFVARNLGLNVALYDGSFSDWSNNTRFPIETGR
jgi:thiosulfate/3-mercaptopyruvate sulfurtransferase